MDSVFGRRAFLGASAAVGTGVLLGCQRTEPDTVPAEEHASPVEPELGAGVFAMTLSAAVGGLDPLLMTTAEQTLICRQLYQRLVGVDPNTGAPTETELATGWEISDDELTYTFSLTPGAKFHDGTDCDAKAVVANVQRWIKLPSAIKAVRAGHLPDYFAHVFGDSTPAGVTKDAATGRGALAAVKAIDKHTVEFTLHRRLPGLLPALAHTAFSICSPTALRKLTADKLDQTSTRTPNGPQISGFAEAPVGSGPYRLGEGSTAQNLELVFAPQPNTATPAEQKPDVRQVKLRSYRNAHSRLRVLEQGKYNAFGEVTPEQLRPLLQQGFRFLQRDPFSMAYLGINHQHPELSSAKLRQLIHSALDYNRLAGSYFLGGTKASQAFTPPALAVATDAFPQPFFDAAQLEAELAELDELGSIPLYFPTDTARTWLPLPERTALDITNQLTEAGFTIRPVPVPWESGYLNRVLSDEKVGLYLWGKTGAYRDPLDFLAPILSGPGPARGYQNTALDRLAEQLRHEDLGGATRQDLAAQISTRLAEDVACIPLCSPISALALARQVQHYPTSPVLDEPFAAIRLAT